MGYIDAEEGDDALYAEESPTEWECAATWQQHSQDPYLHEAVRLEPDLLKILELARRSRRIRGYDRVRRYYSLKEFVVDLVGFDARHPALKTMEHFDAVMGAIEGLLPENRSDDPDLLLERGDDGVESILATRPVLPRKTPMMFTADDLVSDPRFAAEFAAQTRSDLEWLAALKITPDPVLTLPA